MQRVPAAEFHAETKQKSAIQSTHVWLLRLLRRVGLPALGVLCSSSAVAVIVVQDDARHTLSLTIPAQRIVSLAPHATELLFAAGAGSKLVGVSEYSDYPPEAKRIASVGGSATLDLERIIALKPDLIVTWGSGNSAEQIAKLRNLGINVFESEPRDFADIASSLERLAQLAGTPAVGRVAADAFRSRLQQLSATYAQRSPVGVFYQIWSEPLMTLNDRHLVSAAIRLCGGRNVFGKLPQLVPTINTEAVLQANPEVIVAGSGAKDDALAPWRRFPQLLAVKHDNLFTLNADTMTRGSPRILDGAEMLCKQLDLARGRRNQEIKQ